MKQHYKTKSLILILCFCINSAFAQTFKDVFNSETTITYLGIDFTHVKVIGQTSAEITDLVDRQFQGINQLVLDEPDKYDVPKALHRKKVPTDISFAEAKNKTIQESDITSDDIADEQYLGKTDINAIVKGYDFGSKTGIGFMIIMESMSKKNEKGSMYLTFVDMATNKVLYTERISGHARGFGLRNYWARPIYLVLDDVKSKRYKEWEREYGS